MGEDEIALFDWLMAGETGSVDRFVSRFAILELCESPTTGCARIAWSP